MFDWYEQEVRALEARIPQEAIVKTAAPVIFYGSSSVRLWTTLAAEIGPLTGAPPREIVNLGFGGSTLKACVHYFDRLVGRVVRAQGMPRSLVFYAGENDLGDGRSVAEVLDAFFWLHALVRDQLGEIPFAFIAIKPSPARAPVFDRICAVNEGVRQQLATRPQSVFIDVHAEMLTPQGTPRRELWSDDGVHLSRAGYDLWLTILTRYSDILFR